MHLAACALLDGAHGGRATPIDVRRSLLISSPGDANVLACGISKVKNRWGQMILCCARHRDIDALAEYRRRAFLHVLPLGSCDDEVELIRSSACRVDFPGDIAMIASEFARHGILIRRPERMRSGLGAYRALGKADAERR